MIDRDDCVVEGIPLRHSEEQEKLSKTKRCEENKTEKNRKCVVLLKQGEKRR